MKLFTSNIEKGHIVLPIVVTKFGSTKNNKNQNMKTKGKINQKYH